MNLCAFILLCLALFNVVFFKPIELGDFIVPADLPIQCFSIMMHFRKEDWGDDVFEFRPERWLQEGFVTPASFIPFGSGRRHCIGKHFAQLESKIAIATIVQKTNFKIKDGHKVSRNCLGLIIKPSAPLLFHFEPIQ